MAAKKASAKKGAKKRASVEPPFPRDCPPNLVQMCKDLKEWGEEWQLWGEDARQEIKFLRDAVCDLERRVYHNVPINAGSVCDAQGPISENGGSPPQDPTGPPPKPPFK